VKLKYFNKNENVGVVIMTDAPISLGRKDTAKKVFVMSRPPFHIVGILPFVLGTVLANRLTGILNVPVFILSLIAVILVMLLTYYNGEYYDIKEDALAAKMGKNTFSGGSQVIAQNMLPRKYAKIGSYISLVITVCIGLVLQFYFKTGILTIALGAIGIFLGYFYSNPPIRWVSRGVGELFIGFAYGWLTVSTAFYIQAGYFSAAANWISIPIALSIFNVILINEFPDYSADSLAGKRNIVVRIGKEKSAIIYICSAVLMWVFFGLSLFNGAPLMTVYFGLPFFLIAVFIVFSLIKKAYLNHKKLEMLCGMTLVINIGITFSYIFGIAFGY
jgi:1,4-dihydroxy-2-naphthoate polyprenyltransferase